VVWTPLRILSIVGETRMNHMYCYHLLFTDALGCPRCQNTCILACISSILYCMYYHVYLYKRIKRYKRKVNTKGVHSKMASASPLPVSPKEGGLPRLKSPPARKWQAPAKESITGDSLFNEFGWMKDKRKTRQKHPVVA